MAKRQLPSPEELRQLLRYEPETGKLFWRERPAHMFNGSGVNPPAQECRMWNGRYAGTEALACLDSHGYLHGRIRPSKIYAHRAAWAVHYGEWPTAKIDHIDGNRANNRLINLRLASDLENGWNRGANKNNTTGFKGVTCDRRDGYYYARIMANGVYRRLGRAKTAAEANALYSKAAERLHGSFARSE